MLPPKKPDHFLSIPPSPQKQQKCTHTTKSKSNKTEYIMHETQEEQGMSPSAARYPPLCYWFGGYSLKISTLTVTLTLKTATLARDEAPLYHVWLQKFQSTGDMEKLYLKI